MPKPTPSANPWHRHEASKAQQQVNRQSSSFFSSSSGSVGLSVQYGYSCESERGVDELLFSDPSGQRPSGHILGHSLRHDRFGPYLYVELDTEDWPEDLDREIDTLIEDYLLEGNH